jgi:hypothetical protein
MVKNAPARESVAAYKTRLRRTAFAIPEDVIRKGIESMKKRCKAVYEAEGGNIARD